MSNGDKCTIMSVGDECNRVSSSEERGHDVQQVLCRGLPGGKGATTEQR